MRVRVRVRVRFGSTEFSKRRFEFGSVRFHSLSRTTNIWNFLDTQKKSRKIMKGETSSLYLY
jgi:hypothetical protein